MTTTITPAEAEAAYQEALKWIDWLDPLPVGSSRLAVNLYRADGRALLTLDEVIRALEAGELTACPSRVEWLGEM